MATTFFETNTVSPGSTDLILDTTQPGATSTKSYSTPKATSTPLLQQTWLSGALGITDWGTGTYTVDINITAANTTVSFIVELVRYAADGVTILASASSAAQSAGTTGVKTVTFSSPSLDPTGRSSTDLLGLQLYTTNSAAHSAASITIQVGDANAEVVVPFALAQVVTATMLSRYEAAGLLTVSGVKNYFTLVPLAQARASIIEFLSSIGVTQNAVFEAQASASTQAATFIEAAGKLNRALAGNHESSSSLLGNQPGVYELLASAATQANAKYEASALLAGNQQSIFEVVASAAMQGVSAHESSSSLVRTQQSMYELLATAAKQAAAEYESLGTASGVSQTEESPYESLGPVSNAQTEQSQYESLGPVSRALAANHEGIASVLRSYISAYENLTSAGRKDHWFEFLIGAVASATSPWETTLGITNNSQSAISVYEAVGILSAALVTPYELLKGNLSAAAQTSYEAVVSAVASVAANHQSLKMVLDAFTSNYLSLASPLAQGQGNYDSSLTLSSDSMGGFESLQTAVRNASSDYEALKQLIDAITAQYEFNQPLANEISNNFELLFGVMHNLDSNIEAAGQAQTLAKLAKTPYESMLTLDTTVSSSYDTLSALLNSVNSNYEFAKSLLHTVQSQYEVLQQHGVSNAQTANYELLANTFGPVVSTYETLIGIVQQRIAQHETLQGFSIPAISSIESQSSPLATRATDIESLSSAANTSTDEYESLYGSIVDRVSAIETLALVANSMSGLYAAAGQVKNVLDTFHEAAGKVFSASGEASYENLIALSNAMQSAWEQLIGAQDGTTSNIESRPNIVVAYLLMDAITVTNRLVLDTMAFINRLDVTSVAFVAHLQLDTFTITPRLLMDSITITTRLLVDSFTITPRISMTDIFFQPRS